jgi:hypothetical protein
MADVRLTPIAVTKLAGLFPNPNPFETTIETRYDTRVCTTKITGITANSSNLSAVNCEANFVKTVRSQLGPFPANATGGNLLRHGVNKATFKLATNFCLSASNMPCLATIYPGRLTHTTSITASKTSKTRCPSAGCDEWSLSRWLRKAKVEKGLLEMTAPKSLPATPALRRYDVGFVKKPILSM